MLLNSANVSARPKPGHGFICRECLRYKGPPDPRCPVAPGSLLWYRSGHESCIWRERMPIRRRKEGGRR